MYYSLRIYYPRRLSALCIMVIYLKKTSADEHGTSALWLWSFQENIIHDYGIDYSHETACRHL